MLQRPDWSQALEMPVGIVPGGTGNGLARSLGHWLGEPYLQDPVLVSSLNLVHGRTTPMDLVLVEQPDSQVDGGVLVVFKVNYVLD